ncbi:glycosyltransferase [Pinisolibacter sp.]|mgnify:CR=1 FL=1|uniref:glycosyltransferase n=1 Tax=Pinisolibacter sp. TaxID=2172024 RepID=UPI002FDDF37C
MFVFFHQNDVTDAQGGIERYVDTLVAAAGDDARLISEEPARPAANRIGLRLPKLPGPKWIPFALAVVANVRRIRAALANEPKRVLEFSRPEYVAFAWMFPGAKVFTIHGTGPGKGERAKRLVHDLACWFLPLVADRVQVVGRDDSGLSAGVVARLGPRLAHIDAWYDDVFTPRPLPAMGKTVVFYAGRIVEQKNPKLLFEIIREGSRRHGDEIEFRYFGGDTERIAEAGLADLVTMSGLLDARGLAAAIADCHMGLMCSHFGEGSPFIVVETLACGRPYVLSKLPTLVGAYAGNPGVRFAEDLTAEAFLAAIDRLAADLAAGLSPEAIASSVGTRARPVATRALLGELAALAR